MTHLKLTLGPIFFNWSAEKRLDFYTDIAKNSAFDIVYLGDIICAKRQPLLQELWGDAKKILENAGKEVVFSLQGLLTSSQEAKDLENFVKTHDFFYEINDFSSLPLVQGRPFSLGQMLNIYNEGVLDYCTSFGACRHCAPAELNGASIQQLAQTKLCDLEVQVFGRSPLAIAARCYHARSEGLGKHNCQYICQKDPDGLEVDTIDHHPFLTINGTQTLSFSVTNLAAEIPDLIEKGVTHFRLSPHDVDMSEISHLYRKLLNGEISPQEVLTATDGLIEGAPQSNGFYYNQAGIDYTHSAQ